VSGNFAGHNSGGIFAGNGLDLENSTISGNSAGVQGGGLGGGRLTLVNGTVANNNAPSGGGIAAGFVPTLKGTLVADNIGGDCMASVTSQGYNLDSDGSCGLVHPTDQLNQDPLLMPLADNGGSTQTHALGSGSPAIDGIPAADCTDSTGAPLAVDQRGEPRPQGAGCDIGAYETTGAGVEVHDLAVTAINAPQTVTLTPKKPQLTKSVNVQLQNRSPHNETIPDLATLDQLVTLTVTSLGSCPAPVPVLHEGPPQKPLPLTLKPKKMLTVVFDVTFDCANDPAKGAGHVDYRYTATVDHGALDRHPDAHPADDSCPRSAQGVDPHPDGTIKDKGCAEEVTDVVQK
jgi:hypothetical protein